jgi:hypothetical protein
MQARAHLKLIVSEPPSEPGDTAADRVSMVLPVSTARLRLHWLRVNATVIALWSVSFVLLGVAAALLIARL